MTGSMIEDGRPRVIDPDGNCDGAALSIDEVCHLLQNRRRRGVLRYLREADGTAKMSDIAEAIAAAENGTTVERLDHDERKRVYIALYQTHLPKLDDAGIVEYDSERGNIAATAAAGQLYDAMDAVSPGSRRTPEATGKSAPQPEAEPEPGAGAGHEPGAVPDAESEGPDTESDAAPDVGSDAGPDTESDATGGGDRMPGRGVSVGASAVAVLLAGLAAVVGVSVGRAALPVVAGLLLASASQFAIGTVRGPSD